MIRAWIEVRGKARSGVLAPMVHEIDAASAGATGQWADKPVTKREMRVKGA